MKPCLVNKIGREAQDTTDLFAGVGKKMTKGMKAFVIVDALIADDEEMEKLICTRDSKNIITCLV
ncbi:hypothetical protein SPD48_10355 [Pseudogracilibacillus sp. SE30717A]|uniref:hypothetical protein n=1 Tax=Pseudogracilibacillus sp. SE30717A TaxID=3098293 RepID=UPI00300E2A21